jgi:hypothetical protein
MIKYRHKETGLFLKKSKQAYSSVYSLDKKGTTWQRHCLGTLSLIKSCECVEKDGPGSEPFFRIAQFEKVEYQLVEETQIEQTCIAFLDFVENDYYYNSGGWIHCETDTPTPRRQIYQEFLKTKDDQFSNS